MPKPSVEERKQAHPSQDYTDRHALDRLLREFGWRIVSRRNGAEPTWSQDGLHAGQSQILDCMDARIVREARKRQLSYWRQRGLSD